MDAALAATPARSLRAAGRPRPGPGTLTHSHASVAHNPGLRPRVPRAGLRVSQTAPPGAWPSARPVNPQHRHGTPYTGRPEGLWQPPIPPIPGATYIPVNPPEWGQLASLQGFYLPGNRLTGSLPSEWGQLISLQRLRWLDLRDNQLTCFPFEFLHNVYIERDLPSCPPPPGAR